MTHSFANLAQTITSPEGLAERVLIETTPGATPRAVDAPVRRLPVQPVAEQPALQSPRYVVTLADDADLGVTASTLDTGLTRLGFPDLPGGPVLWHSIGRATPRRGRFVCEIFGVGNVS